MAGTLTIQNLQGPTSGANANKIIIPSGQTLDASGATLVPSAGHVVQVVHNKAGANTSSTTKGTWHESYNLLEITPNSSSSKVLVFGQQPVRMTGTDATLRGAIRIKRKIGSGSYTVVWNTDGLTEMFQVRGTPSEVSMVGAFSLLDSPATDDVVRYVLEFYLQTGNGNFICWSGDRGATMTAQEIAQ